MTSQTDLLRSPIEENDQFYFINNLLKAINNVDKVNACASLVPEMSYEKQSPEVDRSVHIKY